MRHVFTLLAAVFFALPAFAGEGGAPPDCDVWLELKDAVWVRAAPDRPTTVALRLRRQAGVWDPRVFGTAYRGFNMATHYGYVLAAKTEGGAERVTAMVRYQPDPWMGRRAEATYDLNLRFAGETCSGTWAGPIHGVAKNGTLTGTVVPVTPVPGFVPPAPGEHPRLLVRQAEIPALQKKAETPWGSAIVSRLKSDKGSPVAQGLAYVLTKDAECAANVRAIVAKGLDANSYYHTGIAHLPAGIAVEHLIGYDLVYDTCDEAFRERVRAYLSNKQEFFYWGVSNTQFNPNDTSNWSLMYRSGGGLIQLTLLDAPWTPPPAPVAPPPLRLAPPANLKAGAGVPVVAHAPETLIGPWLFAGPVEESYDADPFPGGLDSARPETGTRVGNATFAPLDPKFFMDGATDLTDATGRKYGRTSYLYCVLDVKTAGTYRVETTKQEKGIRYREIHLGGRRLRTGDYVTLDAGRYPLLARIWLETMGGWEHARFWLKLSTAPEADAANWQAEREEVFAGDKSEAEWLQKAPRTWNPEALKWLGLDAWKAEAYFLRGLGEYGWNQEGEAYTRHAVRLGLPFAHCWRNVFGRDMSGADHAGMLLALCTAATVFGPDGARMQSFNVGGGPLGLDTFARGFGLLPAPVRPAVLWAWNRSLDLAAKAKLEDPHHITAVEDGLTLAMRFLNRGPADTEKNPGEIMSRLTVDRQKGGYLFRNRWQDAEDCVVSLFANSNAPGGTWSSAEGGTFRIIGLGEDWAVRGQGYGNGASGRNDKDLSQIQNMVDVEEQDLAGSPQAWTTYFARATDGSGIVSLNMNDIYKHMATEKVVTTRGTREVVSYKSLGPKDLGIRAVRSFAVDYSGASGAPCLVAVADRLTGTKGQNTWQMAVPREQTVKVEGNVFTLTAKSGATLKGTVVAPAGAAVETIDYEHTHETNYHGGHARAKFLRRAIFVKGTDADQTFLVVMTLQRGAAPAVTVDTGKANLGKQTVAFDGKRITLGAFEGKVEPLPNAGKSEADGAPVQEP